MNDLDKHEPVVYLNSAQSKLIRETSTTALDSDKPIEYINIDKKKKREKKPETAINVVELSDVVSQPDLPQVLDLQFKVVTCLLYILFIFSLCLYKSPNWQYKYNLDC